MAATSGSKSQVKPFTINIPQSALDDLQQRLKLTRWPDEAPNSGWTMGTNLTYMKDLVNYWQNKYDWRKHEAELNQFNHFTADVNGVNVHFIHERGKGANPTPILLLHGWPDSFYRYHNLIPLLTDPASFGGDANQSFDVIVPSIPGFGFSERKAMSYDANAALFATLMTDILGYQKFICAGGDGGAIITISLSQNHPDILSGIYLTDVGYPDHTTDFSSLSPTEQEFAGFIQQWFMQEGPFNMIRATKPQSLAFSMHDSPVGLAAWIMSFMMWGSTPEDIEKRFGQEELLTNIMIYWLSESIGSSFRVSYEVAHAAPSPNAGKRSDVPAAVAHCPWDAPLPRDWAVRKVNLQHFTDLERGGHFAAWEEPRLYAKDVQDFVRQLSK
ncbi:MAG: epoxide hydrolase family protein [Chloroflexota bacterium]